VKTKACTVCNRELPIGSFGNKAATSDGFNYSCRECVSEYAKKYRKDNTEKVKECGIRWVANNKRRCAITAKRRRTSMYYMADAYKNYKGCVVCGEKDPVCLVFHHKNPEDKVSSVADGIATGWGEDKILTEIEKCDILCANCHLKLHSDERKSAVTIVHTDKKKRLISMVDEYKTSRGCAVCGESRSECLVFHHRNPEDKVDSISNVLVNHWPEDKLIVEMEKCDVLCANCHKKLHWKERNSI